MFRIRPSLLGAKVSVEKLDHTLTDHVRRALGIDPPICSECVWSCRGNEELDCINAEACKPELLTQRFARLNREQRACGRDGKFWKPRNPGSRGSHRDGDDAGRNS